MLERTAESVHTTVLADFDYRSGDVGLVRSRPLSSAYRGRLVVVGL